MAHRLIVGISYYDTNGRLRVMERGIGMEAGRLRLEDIDIEASIEPGVMLPSHENEAMLLLRNIGSSTAYRLRLDLDTGKIALLGSDGHWELTSLGPGEEESIRLRLFVPRALEGSSGAFRLSMSYEDEFGNLGSESRSLGYRVGSYGIERIDAGLTILDPILEPGRINIVRMNVTNTGLVDLKRIEIGLAIPVTATGSPISIVSHESVIKLHDLKVGESRVVSLPIYVSDSASGGSVQLGAKLRMVDEMGVLKVDERGIGLSITERTRVPRLIITSGMGELIAGRVSEVRLKVTNGLGYAIDDLVIGPISVERGVSIVGGGRIYLGRLEAGDAREFSIALFADHRELADRATTLGIGIEYREPFGNIRREEYELGLYVRGLIILSVSDVRFSYVAGVPTVTGNLLNEGNVDALYTRIGIGDGEMAFLGDISPGVMMPFTLPLEPGLEEGQLDLTLRISYRDGSREEHTEEVPITIRITQGPVEAESGEEAGYSWPYTLIAIAGIAAIGGLAILSMVRKRARAT